MLTRHQDFDRQHISLITDILINGSDSNDRTGVGTRKIFGHMMKFDISDNYFPILRTRRVAARIAFRELQWMLSGSTDAKELQDDGIHIWDGNTSYEYLERIGKTHIPVGTIGKGYGYQFRNFNGVDQLQEVIDGLKSNPYGRRHIISLWNVTDFKDMALEPCHMMYNFGVTNGKLNLVQYIRSNDVILGQPTNIMFASFFLQIMAKIVGLKVGEVSMMIGDAHIYQNHIEAANNMVMAYEMNRTDHSCYKNFQYWSPPEDMKTLEDFLALKWEDVKLEDYEYLLLYTRKDLPMAA